MLNKENVSTAHGRTHILLQKGTACCFNEAADYDAGIANDSFGMQLLSWLEKHVGGVCILHLLQLICTQW